MLRWTTIALLAILGSLIALPATAQWKWRDARGQIQYSDLAPPAGVADKDVLQRPREIQQRSAASALAAASAASAAGLLTPPRVEPELEAKRRQAEQDKAAKAKAEDEKVAAAKANNCEQARAQMRQLDSGMRIARVNEKGEREIFDDAQRADSARRMREIIATDCR